MSFKINVCRSISESLLEPTTCVIRRPKIARERTHTYTREPSRMHAHMRVTKEQKKKKKNPNLTLLIQCLSRMLPPPHNHPPFKGLVGAVFFPRQISVQGLGEYHA